ncbi:MAG TPA: metalloregulator ArsR/SmtB family transcription factor [Actinomycetota bacterium]|jgi:DNA-binding transcriptional ArsR family regulator|nr:metalloregulator ArsR/SmtB family transcription factor [Actinomycetota bacterium]
MTAAADTLDRTFAALADPTRRAILERLAAGEATVQELARPFPISLPAVSKHLKVLERAGLIARGRRAQWRPAELRAEPLHEAADWLEEYRRLWEGRLDRLDAFLKEIRPDPDRERAGYEPTGPDPAGPDPKGDQEPWTTR